MVASAPLLLPVSPQQQRRRLRPDTQEITRVVKEELNGENKTLLVFTFTQQALAEPTGLIMVKVAVLVGVAI